MRKRFDAAIDHLIMLHKIEEDRIPEPGLGKALGAGIFLCAFLLAVGAVGRNNPITVMTAAGVGERELPIYCVEREEPLLALTFDASWKSDDMADILEILRRQDVRATFFVTGSRVENAPEEIKAILRGGHELGNHSQSHLHMTTLNSTEKREEIMTVHRLVKELTGYEMTLFRAPYGDYDSAVVKTARACGYDMIQWDINSLDWKDYGAEAIVREVTKNEELGPGSIILCHCGTKYTAEALEEMIVALKEAGYLFVPVSELIYHDHYRIDQSGRQISTAASEKEQEETAPDG